jgi:hypothetical protein
VNEKQLKIRVSVDNKTGELKIINRDFDSLKRKTDKASSSINKVSSSLVGVVSAAGAAYIAYNSLNKVMKDGFSYNKQIEEAKSGLIALSVAVQDESIPVMDRYSIANKEAIATLTELQKINVETPHTLNQTNQIYKAMYVSMKNAGASTSEIVELTRSLSIASGAAGIEFNSLLAGVDGLATGTVLANSDLGRFLSSIGLTNEALKDSDDVVSLVTSRMKDFKAADTMSVAVSNLENSWNTLTGKLTAQSFQGAKTGINELSSLINKMSNDDIEALSKGVTSFGAVVMNVMYGSSVAVVEVINAFDSLGARIAGVTYRLSEGVFLSDSENAALERMYQNTKDNINAREDFLEILKKSKDAAISSMEVQKQQSVSETEYANILNTKVIPAVVLSKEEIKAKEKAKEKAAKDAAKAAKELATELENQYKSASYVYEKMLEIKGTDYDKWLYEVGNEMGQLAENGASVNQQLDYYDYKLKEMMEESSHEEFLSMVNQELVNMYNNQASVNSMVERYNQLSSQRNEALAQGATIDKIIADPEKYAYVDFSNVAAGSLGTDKLIDDNTSAIEENTKAIGNTYNNYGSIGSFDVADEVRIANIKKQLAELKDRDSTVSSVGNMSSFFTVAADAGKYTTKEDILRANLAKLTGATKGEVVDNRAEEERIKEEERLAEYVSEAADAMEYLSDALDNLEGGISSLATTLSSLESLQSNLVSLSSDNLQAQFFSSLNTVRELESALLLDPTNIQTIADYQAATETYVASATAYLQEGNFASRQDYLFAKATASTNTDSFINTASSTDILLQQIADLTTLTNTALSDGNITAEEAKALNAASNTILTNGISTTDSAAYTWLSSINNATADGVVSIDELQGITNSTNTLVGATNSSLSTVNSSVTAQTSGINTTATNTGKIGRYTVSNTYETVYDGGSVYRDLISQTFTPYAKGGFTTAQGERDETGYKVAGVVHEGEWVAPQWMLKENPSLFQALEMERLGKNTTISSSSAPTAQSGSRSENKTDKYLFVLADEMKKMNGLLRRVTDGGEAMKVESVA